MVEGALNAAAELVLEKTAYGNLLERDGNRSPNVAPQGLYRGTRATRRGSRSRSPPTRSGTALVDALGRPGVGDRPRRWRTYAGRRARHDELDAHLGSGPRRATSARRPSCWSRTACPPRVGRDPRSMIDHPQLQAPAASTRTSTTRWSGVRRRRRVPFRFASVDRWLRTPAPTLGQHNHEILVDDLGIDDDAYQALIDAQIIGDRPLGL